MMKKILLISFLLAVCSSLFAIEPTETAPKGKGKITGTVFDKLLNKPIEYTNLVLYSAIDSSLVTGTISDENGNFQIEKVPYGKYYLVANFIGYQKKMIGNIELSSETKDFQIEKLDLEPAIEKIEDVEVVADRNYVDFKIDKKVVNVSQHTDAAGSTAAQVLENVPSVQVDIEGNVSLRGSMNYTVLIDGRPTILSGPEMLKQTPANSIENIEIITNPSAKYDPDGTAGIINIIMKKEKLEGINGLVSVSAGTKGKYGGDFNVNFKREKANIFVGGSYNLNNFYSVTTNNRESYLSDTVSFLTENTDRMQANIPWNFTTGADFYLSPKSTLTLQGTIGGYGQDRDFDTRYHEYDTITGYERRAHSENIFKIDGVYYSGTISFRHYFAKEGHLLDASLTAWNWNGESSQNTREVDIDNEGAEIALPKELRTLDEVYRENLQVKLDYTLPLGTGKVEAGLQAFLNPGTNDYTFENYDSELSEWVYDSSYSNSMDFKRNLYSVYSTYSNQFLGFQYQLGLRAEYTDRLLEQLTLDQKWPLEILNFYPTVHLSRQLAKEQQIQLSYSRRIDRPQPWDLNPFPSYNDSYNAFAGNPLLKPADTDALEFNYIKRIKMGMLSATAFYRQSRNTKLMSIDNKEGHNLIITWENLGRIDATGMEFMTNLNLKKWWTITLSGNLFYIDMQGELIEEDFSQASMSFDTRLTSIFRLGKNTRLQATAVYSSPHVEGQGKKEADFITAFGFRHDFLDRRASISLNVRDPFNTHYYKTSTRNDRFYSYFSMDGESPTIRISLSYRLNDYQRRREEADIQIGGGM
ncbi:MAG: TonB-dependent receptor family protein [Bacteroidales bacterium]|nr:TonB-dependent receptor family protein [Bacteroidales bacterium]MCF8455272.1 TonB-dependent receptor family protein [Bacteroidales bacterium]